MTELETEVVDVLDRLHRAKSAAYGDAWRKRGEVLSIFCNIARKYDRLEVKGIATTTESELDTVADLAIYACKYVTWLAEMQPDSFETSGLENVGPLAANRGDDAVSEVLRAMAALANSVAQDVAMAKLGVESDFGAIEQQLIHQSQGEKTDAATERSKVAHAIGLAGHSLQLLFAMARADHSWRASLEAEIA